VELCLQPASADLLFDLTSIPEDESDNSFRNVGLCQNYMSAQTRTESPNLVKFVWLQFKLNDRGGYYGLGFL
jgi:hypothetical protein